MTGTIETIFYANTHGEPQQAAERVKLVVGRGLEGDRYFNSGSGVVSLIESEAVEEFNKATGLTITAADTRRNIVTRGIALNPLLGKTFRINDLELEAFELCEPCASLGKQLATSEVSPADVVKTFLTSAGIRAYVRSTGVISVGNVIG